MLIGNTTDISVPVIPLHNNKPKQQKHDHHKIMHRK
jgi:hypothetical protein